MSGFYIHRVAVDLQHDEVVKRSFLQPPMLSAMCDLMPLLVNVALLVCNMCSIPIQQPLSILAS